MTTLVEAEQAVLSRFLATWTSTPRAQVVFGNEHNDLVDASEQPWVRVSVSEVGGGQESLGPIGSRKYRRKARVDVQVMTKAGSGAREGKRLAEVARAIFEGASFSGVDCFDCRVHEQYDDEKWLITRASAAFEFTETK